MKSYNICLSLLSTFLTKAKVSLIALEQLFSVHCRNTDNNNTSILKNMSLSKVELHREL